ncbi:MAG: branched-chain amino acid ABC transporter permease [Candidatus Pacebacteria bacterium]|nr:branched-chain amino acid ABC transporter permease [Candidatus Paceibacterota bacterium]
MDIIPQLIANSIIAGALYALIALGFNLIYGATKFFNLTHGVIAAIGGYTVFFLTNSLGWNIYLAAVAGVLFAGLVGYGLEKILYKPLRKRKASQMILLVASLGAFTAMQAIIAIIFSSQFQTLSLGAGDLKTFNIFGGIITVVQLVMLVSALIIMVLLGVIMRWTMFGKAVEAISDEEEVAKVVGIHTNKIIGRVFFIGSAIAGLAGVLVGLDTGLEPTMGMSLLLKGVIASIIGGVGNVYGAVLGAFLLGFVENFGIWKISGEWKDAIAFGVLIIFLLFRPQGILRK